MVEMLVREFPLSKGSFEYADYIKSPTQQSASEFITRAIEDNLDQIAKKENYLEYIAKRPRAQRFGSHGLFSGNDDALVLSKVQKEVANHSGVVWLPIISLRREDAARLGYDDAQKWKGLLSSYAMEMAEAMKIPWEQFRWYAAFHDEGTHPHVHMVCYSADGKSGFLTEKGIEKIKSGLAKEIFRQELTEVYAKQTQRRDSLNQDAQKTLRQLIQQMQDGALNNERIAQLMLELSRQLKTTSGKKQYGYLRPQLKALVDEIVDELERDERVAAAYSLWYELREEVLRTYKDTMLERLPLFQQKEFKRIKNLVIQEAVRLGEYMGYFSPGEAKEEIRQEEKESLQASAEQGNSFAQYRLGKILLMEKDPDGAIRWLTASAEQGSQFAQYTLGKLFLLGGEVERNREAAVYWLTLSAEQENIYAQYFLLHLDDFRDQLVRQGVVRLFHHLGNLFLEQLPPAGQGVKMGTDHKLRRKLREKRVAQGHKRNDHEPVMTS